VAAVTGLSAPTALAFAPDGRLFILEQGGNLKVAQSGQSAAAQILHINLRSDGERGLLGIAFDPQFFSNGYIYLYYTASTGSKNPPTDPTNRVSRFTVAGNTVDPNTETIILNW